MIPAPLLGYRGSGLRRYPANAGTAPPTPPPDPIPPIPVGPMPGQFAWRNGANNFLFGANDTGKWPDVNTTTSPAIKALLATLHLPIIREWFPKYRNGKSGTANTNTDYNNLVQVCVDCGAACLGVLYQWQDIAYLKQVVGLLGNRCNMYEFGNEPYGTDYPSTGSYQTNVSTYVTYWKNSVPQLKAINPNAKFMGPSSPGDLSTLDVMLAGMKAQGVTPDAVSYHYYGPTSSIISQVDQARVITNRYFGTAMPLWLTEWNIGGVYPLPPQVGNDSQMHDYVVATLNALIGHVDAAMHFDIANQTTYPLPNLDMINHESEATVSAKGSYFGMLDSIAAYHP